MTNFFNDTMQGLLEAIAIKNGEIEMEDVLTYEDYNIIRKRSCRRVSETTRITKKQQETQKKKP